MAPLLQLGQRSGQVRSEVLKVMCVCVYVGLAEGQVGCGEVR